ncbi:alpha-ribazole phosphatase [Parasediminibacterium paludis]|uniref:Alpha-ribazole phosphatase n=1 Tax=Parasediminibacterium paludis TaxID=908966 RepID=A0ABV8Q037_9BACT
MEIYLIRHTTPDIVKGLCYGQTDLDVIDTFFQEVEQIKPHLPATITTVYSSPLQRCSKLANVLFPTHTITYHAHLQEINCGDWEMQHWDEIPKQALQPFLADFVNVAMPSGESYIDLYNRVTACFNQITKQPKPIAIVAHGGVIRSILSHITNTPLIEAFNVFKLYYGCVVKIMTDNNEGLTYQILHNVLPLQPEQHKPSVL